MSTKIFTVDKFLGLNESGDGTTELKLGEAAVAENFYITDGYNLKARPGVTALRRLGHKRTILNLWDGMIGNCRWSFLLHRNNSTQDVVLTIFSRNAEAEAWDIDGNYTTFMHPDYPTKIFSFGDRIYIVGSDSKDQAVVRIISVHDDGGDTILHYDEEPYVPLTLTGCAPSGGGTKLEPMNLLVEKMRVQFSSDGVTTKYVLPSIVQFVSKVIVDGVELEPGLVAIGREHTYTFDEPPAEGVNNVEFHCNTFSSDLMEGTLKFLQMRHHEAFNGATDSRMFFYGDGTNVCYYTGSPAYGKGLYLPSGYEIAVDSSASAITGMRRHYTKLMAYKADCAFSIDYEPVTLEDGTITAGFCVRAASRTVGNDMDNQIQTVNNFPRTLCAKSLYEWRHTASYYQDERYAKRISEKITRTLSQADHTKIVTADDNTSRTYYMFLGDEAGTVLVNRYDLDTWTIYTGEVFKDIRFASCSHGDLVFANSCSLFSFDPNTAYDAAPYDDGNASPVRSRWESGYMAFGADYRRKYSSTLWVSILPEVGSKMDITVKTDRREEYLIKEAGRPLLGFGAVDFSNFSFLISRAPKLQRVKIKVKKFVYYKLIFEVNHPGARATIMSYDQQVRFSSPVK